MRLRRASSLAGFLLLLMLAAGWVPAHAAVRHRHARQDVLALEEQWRQAQLTGDTATMDRLLAEDYLGVSPFGVMSTKAQTLRRAAEHEVVFHSLVVTDRKVKVVGTVAIVSSRATVDAVSEGHPLRGEFLYTRIYKRTPAGWKITSFEATPVRS